MSESANIHEQLWRMVVGDLLGYGVGRNVYVCETDPTIVIKIEDKAGSFQNVIEWETWLNVKCNPKVAKWFAPCRYISPNGAILVQSRTRPPAPHEFPDQMPRFLTDFKRTNYGVLGRQFVAHDYGTNNLYLHGIALRMRKVSWWNLEDRQPLRAS